MVEPVQSLVVLLLEKAGYFVRSNVRYATPSTTPTGKTSAYGDLDIIAVRFDPMTGRVEDRIWGEVKAQLTLSLTQSYIRGFLKNYALMLDLTKAPVDDKQRQEFSLRQEQALETATALLGPNFRRVLYFGGRIPKDSGHAARQFLHPDLRIEFVRDLVSNNIASISHREGNDPLFRTINMLSAYGLLAQPIWLSRFRPSRWRITSSPLTE